MRNFILILGLCISCVACDKQKKTPPHILSREKMTVFLIDLHLAEAKINDLSLRRDSAEKLFHVVEDSLYRKHDIPNDSIYKISYEYYLKDVEGLEAIYSAVVDSLSLRERLNSVEKKD